VNLRFNCPSCGAKLRPVEGMDHATQVVRRTCPKCRETWQLKVSRIDRRPPSITTATAVYRNPVEAARMGGPVPVGFDRLTGEDLRLDQAEFTFIERRPTQK